MLVKRSARYMAAARARRARATAARRAGPAMSIPSMVRFNRAGSELKAQNFLLPAGFNSIGNSWEEFDFFSLLTAGDDIGQRNGRRIYVRAIEVRGILAGAQSNIVTDDANDTVRIVIGKYTGASGALTPLRNSGGAIVLGTSIVPGYGQNCQRVYYDQFHHLQSPGRDSVGYVGTSKPVVIKIKCPMICTFTGTTSGTNMDHLVMSCISDSAIAPNPGFTYYSATLYYTD